MTDEREPLADGVKRQRHWWQKLFDRGTLVRIECALCHETPIDQIGKMVVRGHRITMQGEGCPGADR